MKIIKLPICFNSKGYFFNKWTGIVLEKLSISSKDILMPNCNKLNQAYEKLLNPYLLKPSSVIINTFHYNTTVIYYARFLVFLCNWSFYLAFLFSKLKIVRFNSAAEAFIVFRDIFPKDKQNELCLPRALFAASTSLDFKKSGVLFIGIFMPSKHMHAWIIENNIQPDSVDDIWIFYQPFAAII